MGALLGKQRSVSKSKQITDLKQTIKKIKVIELQKINNFLSNLHDSELLFSRSADEIKDIKLAVEDMVERIISEFGEYGTRQQYEISHKYLVGSMAEGTSIKEPNEFDFLVVLKKLSFPSALDIILVDKANECPTHMRMMGHTIQHAHLKVKDPNSLKTFERYISNDGCLEKSFLNHIARVDIVNTAIAEYVEDVIYKNTGQLMVINMKSGPYGPAGNFLMKWTPNDTQKSQTLQISIDIVIAIEVSHHVAREDDANIPKYFNQLKEDNSCLLLPASYFHGKCCFKFTFTQTEVKLVKSLSEFHRTCYRLMKYIVGQGGDEVSKMFPSYLIKTVILRHSVQCQEEKNFLACIVDIITKMSDTCRHSASVHIAERTLFLKENFVSETHYREEEYQTTLGCLTEVVKQLVSNAETC